MTVKTVRAAVRAVLEDERYRESARRLQAEIDAVDGLARAADVIEEVLGIALTTAGAAPLKASAEIFLREDA